MSSGAPRPGGRTRARRAEAIYRRGLRLLPRAFRREAEPHLLEVFRDGWSAARGPRGRARFWITTLADLLVTAFAERIAGRRTRRRRRTKGATRMSAPRGGSPDGREGGTLVGEVRASARLLARHPGRTALTGAVLGIGVAATVLMLVLVRDILLRPLPFDEPDRLVRLREVSQGDCCYWPSFPNVRDWRDRAEFLAGVVAAAPPEVRPLLFDDRAVSASVSGASRGFFDLLGVRPALGRTFADDENAPGAPAVTVVSWSFWSGPLGARPLRGLSFTLGTERFDVVGVLPRDFRFLAHGGAWTDVDVWTPLERSESLGGRTSHGYHVVARLTPGVTIDHARTEMDLLSTRLAEAHGEPTHADQVRMSLLLDEVVGDLREPLRALLIAAVGVLLVACLNLAAALIGQALARMRELAIRSALGASRARLIRQMVLESVMLTLPAALVGFAAAWAGLTLLRRETVGVLPRLDQVRIEGSDIVIGLAVALAAAVLAGLLPALFAASRAGTDAGTRAASAGRENRLLWRAFVAGQTGLATVLLVGCGLLLRSFFGALTVDLGYDPDSVLSVEVLLPEARYAEEDRRTAFYEEALTTVRSLPGVSAAGITNVLPYETSALTGTVARAGAEARAWTAFRYVDLGYFEALRIPLLRGAELPRTDEARPDLLVDTRLASALWEGEDAIGAALEWPSRVVGIVGSVQEWSDEVGAGRGAIYIDYRTFPDRLLHMYLMVRHQGSASGTAARVRSALAGIDPLVPVVTAPLPGLVRAELADRRVLLLVALAFGGMALLLSATGVYAVVAFAARRRKREAAIRLSLGARQGQVGRALVVQGLAPAVTGVAFGLLAALPAGLALRAQLFRVEPWDPAVLAGAATFLLAAATLASWYPSRRASRVHPASALQSE